MNQWMNPSHPPTLQAGVFLGYLSAIFGLLLGSFGPRIVGILSVPWPVIIAAHIAIGVGAFVTANNKRWGYQCLAVGAGIVAFNYALVVVQVLSRGAFILSLELINSSVFPVALAAAVVHSQSRLYQKAWFE